MLDKRSFSQASFQRVHDRGRCSARVPGDYLEEIMENLETFAPIEHLPNEIMCIIFDYLDLDSVKRCSLVCRRWKETIFSDYYVKRFQLSYNLDTHGTSFQSDRLYRHVKLCLKRSAFNIVYNVLRYPYLKQYITLELVALAQQNLKLITDAITQMGELREVCILYPYWNELDYHVRSDSLQFLRLENALPTFINTPNLNTFITKMEENVTTVAQLFSYRFPDLKHLEIESETLWENKDVEHVIRFFAHLKGLETLILRGAVVYGFAFKAICENCSNLEKLHIQNMCFINGSMINRLSKLTKLGELTLEKIDCINPVSFTNVNLPQLKTFGMGNFRMQHETLEAFRSATKLKLFHEKYTKEFNSAIARSMPLVREVEFMTTVESTILEEFSSVEVIVFHGEKLKIFKQTWDHPKTLLRLKASTKPSDDTIASLLTLFPNLQLLKSGQGFVHKIV